jgi:hypothetical protein
MEFIEFPKIENVSKIRIIITQKIHGTNACVIIGEDGGLSVQSRTRKITPNDDNYGFATFVYKNKESFVKLLGPGYHYGEWAGPGINTGEGLTEKTFILFDFWNYISNKKNYSSQPVELPPQTTIVPFLYHGNDFSMIDKTFDELKINGSKLVPGYMHPEGIVITIGETRYKKVFIQEETQWKKPFKNSKDKNEEIDLSYLLQPIRLEKIRSRDEKIVGQFLVDAYIYDLREENQLKHDYNVIKKQLKTEVGKFIITSMKS